MDEWMNGRIDFNQWVMDGCMEVWIDGWMDG